ncbi:MAG: CAP domain-containing protein [Planktomarina sp.]
MRMIILALGALILSGCVAGNGVALGPDGKPLQRLYRIQPNDTSRIQFSLLDGMNSLRQVSGLEHVELNAKLNAAAATHSRDMALQNRPWHFGSDGSSPIDRVQRVGFNGRLLGEAISETYESELETLAAWMGDPGTRNVILNPDAKNIGFAWHQEANGKIWWTLVVADEEGAESLDLVQPAMEGEIPVAEIMVSPS